MDKIDVLNREKFVEKLIELTEIVSENKVNTSFALNGVWGCGKTYVLDMFEEKLNQIQSEDTVNDKYFVIRYNCWKYDYYEEPLIAIVASMISTINQKTKLWNDELRKAEILGVLKVLGTALMSMVNSGIKDKLGLDIDTIAETIKCKTDEEKDKVEEFHKYDSYFSFNMVLKELQEQIEKLGDEYTVVFLVDELDRCLPEYAIKVLERLHHLIENVPNTITIIAMDKQQIENCIHQVFGHPTPEQYLKKFIKFTVQLDVGTVTEKFIERHNRYFQLFDEGKMNFDDSIEEFLQFFLKVIDVREQEQLITRAYLIHKLVFGDKGDKKDYGFLCAELLMVILDFCYNGTKRFSRWLDYIPKKGSNIKSQLPVFFEFFDKKIDQSVRRIKKNTYAVRPKSLYGSIIYMWDQVYENPFRQFVVCPKLKKILDKNAKDLNLFADAIGFIK